MTRTHIRAGVTLALCLALCLPAGAQAAFPGSNGKIAWSARECSIDLGTCEDFEIYSINPDATGRTQLTTNTAADGAPAWSADGTKIAFESDRDGNSEIYVMNADGSGQTRLTTDAALDSRPAWSPDGTEIAFMSTRDGNAEIYTMNADGTGQTRITNEPGSDSRPSWSPDGTRIAFDSDRAGGTRIFVMNSDGSSPTFLAHGLSPNWLPTGDRVAFNQSAPGDPGCGGFSVLDVRTIEADGTDEVNLTDNDCVEIDESPAWAPDGTRWVERGACSDPSVSQCAYGDIVILLADGSGGFAVTNDNFGDIYFEDYDPDWQPIPATPPPPGYARPKGATPFQTYLVPAYNTCTSPNRTHGPPLAFPSCNPPQRSSASVTVGTADANGQPAKYIGKFRYDVMAGDPATVADEADVRIEITQSDVRWASDLTDYTGEMQARMSWRITDRFNGTSGGGGGTEAATLVVIPTFPNGPISCSATADPTVGADCNLTTTVDALLPGAIKERNRTVVELGQVEVIDGGPDGQNGTTPNTLFAVQGIFIP